MKQTVNSYDFVNAFDACGRGNQFSRAARFALFDYLEECEESCECELELDPVAICCEYAEYESATAYAKDHWSDLAYTEKLEEVAANLESSDANDIEEYLLEELKEETQVIEFDGGIVVLSC